MASKLPMDDYPSLVPSPSQSHEDREVDLHVKIVKNVTLRVKASETIKNINKFIKQCEEPVRTDFQELVTHGGLQLKEGNKLSDYYPEGNTLLLLCRESGIKLTVKRLINDEVRSIILPVKWKDTMKEVKSKIDCLEGTNSGEYQLIFKGERLNDDTTVEASNMNDGSVMCMVQHTGDNLLLQFVMPCGRIETFSVRWLYKIFDVKAVVQNNFKIRVDRWHLVYSGKALQDHETVVSCGLKPGSLLHVVLPNVQIFVRIWSGKLITVFVKQTDDVISLKEQIFKKTRCPVEYQLLIYSGRVLKEGRRIFTYGIQQHSTVCLRFKFVPPGRSNIRFQTLKDANRASSN